MHELENHPIIIMFLLKSISNHVNTNPGHKMINTFLGNPRHLGINANFSMEPGVVSTLSPVT